MRTPQKRSGIRRILALSMGLSAFVLGAATPSAHAQAPTIGVLDGVKVNDNFTKLKAAMEAIDKQKQTLRAQLDGRIFMAEADTRRFDALMVKAKRSDAENAELNKLVKSGTDRGVEYNALLGKAAKNDADKARTKSIEDEAQRTVTTFQDIVNKVDEGVRKEEETTENSYRDQIVKVVEQVAGEKKLVLVVGKQAIAWNSATIEITDEVLTRLNKG